MVIPRASKGRGFSPATSRELQFMRMVIFSLSGGKGKFFLFPSYIVMIQSESQKDML
jgi:hypothetical protein